MFHRIRCLSRLTGNFNLNGSTSALADHTTVYSCQFISLTLLVSLVHITFPFMCTPIDLILEVCAERWYRRTVTQRRYIAFLIAFHFLGGSINLHSQKK